MSYVYRRPHWPYSRWQYIPLGGVESAQVQLPASTYNLTSVIPTVEAETGILPARVKIPILIPRPVTIRVGVYRSITIMRYIRHIQTESLVLAAAPQKDVRVLEVPFQYSIRDIHRHYVMRRILRRIVISRLAVVGGVEIMLPVQTYVLNKHIPIVTTGVGVDVIIPIVSSYIRNTNIPVIGISAHVLLPLSQYVLNKQTPVVGTGILIDIPLSSYVLTKLIPTLTVGVGVSRLMPASQYVLTKNIHIIRATGIGPDTADLDLTPPFEETTQTRYLFSNFEILRDALADGKTAQFTTTDGKTVLVRNGVIVDVF